MVVFSIGGTFLGLVAAVIVLFPVWCLLRLPAPDDWLGRLFGTNQWDRRD